MKGVFFLKPEDLAITIFVSLIFLLLTYLIVSIIDVDFYSPADMYRYFKNRWIQRKRTKCNHQWYDLESGDPIQETEIFRYTYRFVDFTSSGECFKINKELDVQERSPRLYLNSTKQVFYCPKCGKEESNGTRISTWIVSKRKQEQVLSVKKNHKQQSKKRR